MKGKTVIFLFIGKFCLKFLSGNMYCHSFCFVCLSRKTEHIFCILAQSKPLLSCCYHSSFWAYHFQTASIFQTGYLCGCIFRFRDVPVTQTVLPFLEGTVVDIISVCKHFLCGVFFDFFISGLFNAYIGKVHCCCRSSISQIKFQTSVGIIGTCHLKHISICRFLCFQVYRNIFVLWNGRWVCGRNANSSFKAQQAKSGFTEDLLHLNTLGFRSEALPSIASVA